MGVIAMAASLLCAVALAVISRLLADEAKAWTPRLTEWFVERATRRLPLSQRARYGEEWRAHICELPGDIARLATAIGYISAAVRINGVLAPRQRSARLQRLVEIALAGVLLLLLFPLLTTIVVALKLEGPGPVIILRKVGRNAEPTLTFRTRRKCSGKKIVVVTRLGQALERLDMDRLPILFDVLRGRAALIVRRRR